MALMLPSNNHNMLSSSNQKKKSPVIYSRWVGLLALAGLIFS
jgi:hypothetical protein